MIVTMNGKLKTRLHSFWPIDVLNQARVRGDPDRYSVITRLVSR